MHMRYFILFFNKKLLSALIYLIFPKHKYALKYLKHPKDALLRVKAAEYTRNASRVKIEKKLWAKHSDLSALDDTTSS